MFLAGWEVRIGKNCDQGLENTNGMNDIPLLAAFSPRHILSIHNNIHFHQWNTNGMNDSIGINHTNRTNGQVKCTPCSLNPKKIF